MRQPFLHDAEIALRAPAQAWTRHDGTFAAPIDGLYVSDVRVLSALQIEVDGSSVEHIRTERVATDRIRFAALLRGLDDDQADPRVRLDRDLVVRADGMAETLTVRSGRDVPLELDLVVILAADLAPMALVKTGGRGDPAPCTVTEHGAMWSGERVAAVLVAEGCAVSATTAGLRLRWRTTVEPHGTASASWSVVATDAAAVVTAPAEIVPLVTAGTGSPELDAWLTRALDDLEGLELALPDAPDDVFLAAGAPWFLTLFGRDSIWAARLLLPIDVRIARGTLHVLARMQGTLSDAETGERSGGIVHELRRDDNPLAGGTTLPPRYYGTIDATPLWILLLHDAWRAGLPDADLRALRPNLTAALGWLEAAVPPDGFLSYDDPTGRGLANQGWKDSADSVQWRDGRLADGPIALCEVQGYAHEAALAAVVLLRALGDAGAAERWGVWAAALKARFRTAFWVQAPGGGYPAIALDAAGCAVDSLTSNIGHLLGTGILDAGDERRVAALLVDRRLDSGFGLRTLSTDSAGFWPLSYHGGAVWAHDTAIAIHGLLRAGFPQEARTLADGVLRAATGFDGRMPELYSGDAAGAGSPTPYPAACRPQAWSAAAAIVVRDALATARTTRSVDPVDSSPAG